MWRPKVPLWYSGKFGRDIDEYIQIEGGKVRKRRVRWRGNTRMTGDKGLRLVEVRPLFLVIVRRSTSEGNETT
jgi:hypothetical protein